jgi:hypothetical protein
VVQLNKSETKDQIVKDAQLWGWLLSLAGVKLHEMKGHDAITSEIKRN